MRLKNVYKKFLFSSIVGCSFFSAAYANQEDSEPTHILEIQSTSRQERQKLTDMGYALDEIRSDKVYVTGRKSDAARIKQAGFAVKAIVIQPQWKTFGSEGLQGKKYSSYAQVVARMNAIVAKNSNIASIFTYGRTQENRDMLSLRISSLSSAQAEAAKLPSIMYMGCHHAREHLSVEVPLMFAEYLVDNYATNATIKNWVDTREIFIAPVVNVDGHNYDYNDGTRGKMWRKNRRNNNNGSFGVDLNRNYGWGWGTGGSSSDTSSDVYMGPSAFSEPETQAVRDFIKSQHRMTTLLSVHTFSELVLYPWGGSDDPIGRNGRGNAADLPVFQKMANDMASWNHYRPMQSSELYIASGDTTDWAYGELGIFAFTFELSPTSIWEGGFYPDPSRTIDPAFAANLKPMMYMLEYADNPRRVLNEKNRPNMEMTPAKAGIPLASLKDLSF